MWKNRGIHVAPLFLTSIPDIRQLYPGGKSPWYPFGRRFGGLESLSEPFGEELNTLPLPVFEMEFLFHTANI